jgi:hypothetical protein
MRALQFATGTLNLACRKASFGNPRSDLRLPSSACPPPPTSIPVSVLSLIPHATARCEDDRYEVHTKLLAQELIDSGLIHRVKMTQLEKPPKFEPYPAPEQIFGNDKDMYYVWERATRS